MPISKIRSRVELSIIKLQSMTRISKIMYTMVTAIILLIWLMHRSINLYWQQAYHKESPVTPLETTSLWKLGGDLNQKLNSSKYQWVDRVESFDEKLVRALNIAFFTKEIFEILPAFKPKAYLLLDMAMLMIEQKGIEQNNNRHMGFHSEELIKIEDEIITHKQSQFSPNKYRDNVIITNYLQNHTNRIRNEIWLYYVDSKDRSEWLNRLPQIIHQSPYKVLTLIAGDELKLELTIGYNEVFARLGKKVREEISDVLRSTKVVLKRGDKVFYVGDSLMQGVAPHVRRTLYKTHGIEGIDLSKQSTGLAYINFFNWPKITEDTFKSNPEIKLMVVYLGPNDPWDFPKKRGEAYMKFKSEEWESVYRERIRGLIKIAQSYNARVLWLGVPSMKRKKLNDGMIYLNNLYQSEIMNHNEFYQSTWDVLGGRDENFASFVHKDGRDIKVRANDGIHFTLSGQQFVADTVLDYIYIDTDSTNK